MKVYPFILVLTFLCICSGSQIMGQEDFTDLKDQFEAALKKVENGDPDLINNLKSGYQSKLEELKKSVQEKGELDNFKAVTRELERFKKEQTLPTTSSVQLPAMVELAEKSQKYLQALEVEKSRRVLELVGKYDSALEVLQRNLTRAGMIKDASEVQKERKAVKDRESIKKALALSTSNEPEGVALPKVTEMKETPKKVDQAVGEWVKIDTNTQFELFEDGSVESQAVNSVYNTGTWRREGEKILLTFPNEVISFQFVDDDLLESENRRLKWRLKRVN